MSWSGVGLSWRSQERGEVWAAQGFSETWQLGDVWGGVGEECVEGWAPIKAGVAVHTADHLRAAAMVRQARWEPGMCCVTLRHSLNFSKTQLPHEENGVVGAIDL